MKTKLPLLFFLPFVFALFAHTSPSETPSKKAFRSSTLAETYVYICISENAYAYHLDDTCRGLKSCSKEQKKVPLSEAINKYSRKRCGWEN